jgi:hypothetical protein
LHDDDAEFGKIILGDPPHDKFIHTLIFVTQKIADRLDLRPQALRVPRRQGVWNMPCGFRDNFNTTLQGFALFKVRFVGCKIHIRHEHLGSVERLKNVFQAYSC